MSDKQDGEEHTTEETLDAELEDAKRCFALKEWSQAANAYGEVLETLREKYAEEDPIFAPIFHRYGHALLEHAIATSGALGGGGGGSSGTKDAFTTEPKTVASARAKEPLSEKGAEQVANQASSSASSSSNVGSKAAHDPRFTFGGDAEDSEEEEEDATKGDSSAKEGGDGEDDDDLSLAFSILELARICYEKVLEGGDSATLKTLEGEEWSAIMIKSQLAEVLNDLADVGLESENFQQASTDYQSALEMLTPLLQPHSRRLADAYLRLGLALEFHPDATLQASAEKYVAGACRTLERRIESLKGRERSLQKDKEKNVPGLAEAEAAASEIRTEKAELESEKRLREEGVLNNNDDGENGNLATFKLADQVFEKDDVIAMDWEQVQKEQKDVGEMIQELRLKMEEYSNLANGSSASTITGGGSSANMTAKESLQQAINEALLGSSTNALGAPPLTNPNAPVNDLSAMVKKKKKVEETNGNGKRKEVSSSAIEDISEEPNGSKKARVD